MSIGGHCWTFIAPTLCGQFAGARHGGVAFQELAGLFDQVLDQGRIVVSVRELLPPMHVEHAPGAAGTAVDGEGMHRAHFGAAHRFQSGRTAVEKPRPGNVFHDQALRDKAMPQIVLGPGVTR